MNERNAGRWLAVPAGGDSVTLLTMDGAGPDFFVKASDYDALRAEVERLKRIEELALIWSAYQFDSRRALHQQADDAAIALLDALDSDKVAARLDAAKRCADPTTGSRDV